MSEPHWHVRGGTWRKFYQALSYDYGQDVGSLHVIDYRLWLAALPIRKPWPGPPPSHLRFSPADWSR